MRRSLSVLVIAVSLLVEVLPAGAATPASQVVAWYDFDERPGAVVDKSGHGHTMKVVSRGGAALRVVSRGGGRALQFPRKCRGAKCPRAVLQTPHRADLNPGQRRLVYGATVRLPRRATTKGQNVLQKGYSAVGSQYKLQVDGILGRPSCVLVGAGLSGIHVVRSSISVADGAWHAIQCRRVAGAVAVTVDGVPRGVAQIPATLSITNRYPLSIGGKGVYTDNDQFQGAIDDAYVTIG